MGLFSSSTPHPQTPPWTFRVYSGLPAAPMAFFRARLGSFLAGFGVAAAGSMYFHQRDLWASHRVLTEQAEGQNASVEAQLARLERVVATIASAVLDRSTPLLDPTPAAEEQVPSVED